MVDFLSNHSLAGLPVFFHGFSSGGTMSLKLPGYLHDCCGEGREEGEAPGPGAGLRIDGIVSVDAAPEGGFGAEDEEGRFKLPSFPPTLFVVMEVRPGRGRLGGWERASCLGSGRLGIGRLVAARQPLACMHAWACSGWHRLPSSPTPAGARWGTPRPCSAASRGSGRRRRSRCCRTAACRRR